MYVDKPMRGHGLMQAIARVNRVFKDKPGGLVVDYLGLAQDMKQARGNLHGERRDGPHSLGSRGGGSGDAGEARGVLCPIPRLQLVQVDYRHPAGTLESGCQPLKSMCWPKRTARIAVSTP